MIPLAGADYFGDENQTFAQQEQQRYHPSPQGRSLGPTRYSTRLDRDPHPYTDELGVDFHDDTDGEFEGTLDRLGTSASGLRSRGSGVETPLSVRSSTSSNTMGSPDTHKMIPGYQESSFYTQPVYCYGKVSYASLMLGMIVAIFVAVAIAAGFIIHMSIATHDTAVRAGVIVEHFEATGAMQAIRDLALDVTNNHIPVIRGVIETVNHTSTLAHTLTASVLAINPAGLLRNTSDAIQRMDDLINHYFKEGAIKLEIPLAPEHSP